VRTFREEAASIIMESDIIRIINKNIVMDRVSYRLFYFRILREVFKHCKQQHIKDIELIADGIIETILDYGLGSYDMSTVIEALEIFQILLERNGVLK